jgi:hypothetical protein
MPKTRLGRFAMRNIILQFPVENVSDGLWPARQSYWPFTPLYRSKIPLPVRTLDIPQISHTGKILVMYSDTIQEAFKFITSIRLYFIGADFYEAIGIIGHILTS